MDKLESYFSVPTIYVQYKFEMIEDDTLYKGSVVFSNTNSEYDAFTFGG